MRGRPREVMELMDGDREQLEDLIRNGRTQQRVARRARILLAMSHEETVVSELAQRVEMDNSGIWHVCQRYQERGIEAVYDAPRSGRPPSFSPSGQGAD